MNYRDARYNEDGSIDCMIDHPKFGLIPFTASPNDNELAGAIVYDAVKDIAQPYVAPPPPVPAEVSRFQARSQFEIMGVLGDVEDFVASADPLVQIAWSDAQVFRRDSPNIAAIAAAIGLTDVEVDDLFIKASSITG